YYRKFVKDLSRLAGPITSLQKKGKKFVWDNKCEEAFKELKGRLTSALVLKILDPNENFSVVTDASGEGLGGVLLQDGHVVAFESRKLRVHE
ncbi:hypothetical protein KI387_010022, partial [Taxus chinensis]